MKKQMFVYPGSDLDRGRNLIAVLGSFWATIYSRRDQVNSYAQATSLSVSQSFQNLLETVAALSRYDVPLFHTENWLPVTLRKSDRNTSAESIERFDRTSAHFDDNRLNFDVPAVAQYHEYPAPKNLAGCATIFNKLLFPSLALAEKVDYVIDAERSVFIFAEDPFDSPETIKTVIYAGAQPVDEEITLWLFKGKFDYDYVFTQFAYALGMRLKTSQGFKDLMNAVFSGLIEGGATAAALDQALAAICNIPLTLDDNEVVEIAQRDAHGTFIATDKNVYRFPEDAVPLVAVGDRLRAGAPLVDAVTVHELTHGDVPAAIAALALDAGYLSACFYGDLVFENKSVPLEVDTTHPSGFTYVSFGVGGYPADVRQFFDEIHARGVAAATAQRNDCFDNPIVRPTRTAFPRPGRSGKIYQATDTHKFYQWLATAPAVPETGSYVEVTEQEVCGPNWDTFATRAAFPLRGNTFKRYLAADTGKLYKWVIAAAAQPETGVYEEVFAPPPRNKIGTLAHVLDKRAQPDSEPTAANLPKTINPLEFVAANVLRNNVFLVQIRINALGQNHLGMYNVRHLRQLLPPQSAMIVVFALQAPRDAVDATENLQETVQTFTGAEPLTDTVPESLVNDKGATLRTISGTCQ